MAVEHQKNAGQWSKQSKKIYDRVFLVMFFCVLGYGVLLGCVFTAFAWRMAWIALLPVLGLIFLQFRLISPWIDKRMHEGTQFLKGGQTEAFVAWRLRNLPDTYHVFHNLPCAKGGDIDHVVVGPAGLFVISTKSFKGHITTAASGTVRLNGQPIDDTFNEAMSLALWVRDRLKAVLGDQVPWVQPVLCLPHVHSDLPPNEGKVWLLNDQTLLETLEPEKPKTKTAAKRVELIAAELGKIAC